MNLFLVAIVFVVVSRCSSLPQDDEHDTESCDDESHAHAPPEPQFAAPDDENMAGGMAKDLPVQENEPQEVEAAPTTTTTTTSTTTTTTTTTARPAVPEEPKEDVVKKNKDVDIEPSGKRHVNANSDQDYKVKRKDTTHTSKNAITAAV